MFWGATSFPSEGGRSLVGENVRRAFGSREAEHPRRPDQTDEERGTESPSEEKPLQGAQQGLEPHPSECAHQGIHTGDILPSAVGPAWG